MVNWRSQTLCGHYYTIVANPPVVKECVTGNGRRDPDTPQVPLSNSFDTRIFFTAGSESPRLDCIEQRELNWREFEFEILNWREQTSRVFIAGGARWQRYTDGVVSGKETEDTYVAGTAHDCCLSMTFPTK